MGFLKCNVDAAFDPSKSLEAISAIIRDYQGRVITGKARKIHTSSSMVVEAMAIREDLILARSCFCNALLLESSCREVVEACRNGSLNSNIAVLVTDILRLRASFDRCGFLWTTRKANSATHEVARVILYHNLSYDWSHIFPLSLQTILEMDKPD